MKKWIVAELNENGDLDFSNCCLYEFTSHNPIRFVNKAIKKYKTALQYGYAFKPYEKLNDKSVKWHFIKPNKNTLEESTWK